MIKNPQINYTQDGLLIHDFIVGLDYGESIKDVMQEIDSTLLGITEIAHTEDLAAF
ncbi:MAG: small conductance mechanosensitive channel [Vicingaceae bacterium]